VTNISPDTIIIALVSSIPAVITLLTLHHRNTRRYQRLWFMLGEYPLHRHGKDGEVHYPEGNVRNDDIEGRKRNR